MRILLVSEVFRPPGSVSGVTVAVDRLAAYLSAQGHQVSVLTSSRNYRFSVEKQGGISVYRFPALPNPFRPGLRVTFLPGRRLRSLLGELRPQLIHMHDPAVLSLATARLARRSGIPLVMTNHFLPAYVLAYLPGLRPLHPLLRRLLERRLARLYNQCSLVIAPTQTVAQSLRRLSLRVPVQVVSNGVETARFAGSLAGDELLAADPLPLDEPLFGFVGRLDPEKRVGTLIRALALTSVGRLVIVGQGRQRSALRDLAEQLGVSGRIHWITRLENSGSLLPQLYGLLAAFCLPCPIEVESIATLEAMAAGRPILAADGGALPELVAEGENGFLLSADDPKAWAAKMSLLAQDPDLCGRMGADSRRRVAGRDLSASLGRIEALYREIFSS